ncbi:MAG TPA: hypothetical protein VNA11_01250 [Pseudonocardia sp.]|nr:hypothetical protein [Pseudonocardia sp.]
MTGEFLRSGANEEQVEATAGRADGPVPLIPDGGLIALLVLDGILLGAAGLAFTPLYFGPVPAPLGALASIVLLPFLVGRAAELDPRFAATPLIAWAITVGLLGVAGPGGDVLLPVTWQSLLLMFGGLGAGLWRLRRG